MNLEIVPSIIATSQPELNKRIKKISSLSKTIHLDVMDGKFVKNTSLLFNFKLSSSLKNKKTIQAHLMIKNPLDWVIDNYQKIDSIIVHPESFRSKKELTDFLEFARKKRKKVGLALNPRTHVKKIYPFIHLIKFVLVMTVYPGKYGAKFLPSTLKKIEKLRKKNHSLKIGIDGGVSNETFPLIKEFNPDFAVVGSYLQKSRNPSKAISLLK